MLVFAGQVRYTRDNVSISITYRNGDQNYDIYLPGGIYPA